MPIDGSFIPLGTDGRWGVVGTSSPTEEAIQILLGIDHQNLGQSTLYDVNESTGETSNPRPLGLDNTIGIAISPSGTAYTVSASDESLYSIDVATGAATLIGKYRTAITEGDLDFDPISGVLYGITTDDLLFTIDVANGAGTVIGGSLANGNYPAMVFDDAGNLYVYETGGNVLVTLDPTNANVLNSVPTDPLGTLAGMEFDPTTGQLLIADSGTSGTDTLYTLDPVTGVLTVVGPTTGAPAGLAGLTYGTQVSSIGIFGLLQGTDEIAQIDPVTGAIINSFPSPTPIGGVSGLSGAEGGTTLIVQDDIDPTSVFRVDPVTGALLSTESMASSGIRAGLSFDGTSIFFARQW